MDCLKEHSGVQAQVIMYVSLFLMVMSAVLGNTQQPVPPACSHVHPADLLEYAIPSPRALPRGVNIIYDRSSHVHAYQFSPNADNIYLKASKIFLQCIYFPYEFSLFITYKQYALPKREKCIFSLFHESTKDILLSLGFSQDRVIFRYQGSSYRFKMVHGYQDRKWHTLGVSMSGEAIVLTRNCRSQRQKPLLTSFPSFLPVANMSFSIGKCEKKTSVFQGLLKSVILVPGGDASVRACPSQTPIEQGPDIVIGAFPGSSSLTAYHSQAAVCQWTDVGNLAFDVHVRKLKVCVNGIWQEVKISTDKRRLDYLLPHQTLDTSQGALDVEVFELPGEGTFAAFALAGQQDLIPTRSNVYQWTKDKFSLYQTLPTHSAQAWEFFAIKKQFFLAVANYGVNPSVPANSTIFKWSKTRKKFRQYQDILTFTARDVEAFEIDGNHYLAIANHAKGDENQIDSVVYKWSKKDRLFHEHQRLQTVGAYDWTYFKVDSYHFLVVANAFTGVTTLAFSVLYIWQDNNWVVFQTMETNGATDWEHFAIGNDHYLAVANAYNYGSQNFQDIDNYRTNSSIYKLDKDKRTFTKYQSIDTNSIIDWEHFTIGPEHFLLVSNAQNGGSGDKLRSILYRWQGVDQFVPVHYLHTSPNADFELFKDNSEIYIIYAGVKNSKSEVLRVKFV